MNTSKDNHKKPENIDQIDDLTRFLDEDFDTDDVDLFEFTTEEDSPLTELKSIVLSLDWDITDETLQDLADEVEHLKGLEKFQADKVSLVYLQGLSKIGHYIQSEGAHAHPNSIKLLLTLYYDFEKVLSSETITGSEITALLKADVRKFKILQYQIAQKHGVEAPLPVDTEAKKLGLIITDSEALKGLQAVILELDWEITDESLNRLTEQLDSLKERYKDNRFIKILVQGLHSINTYIIDERAQAHPESFSLLHSFCDGLAKLIEGQKLGDKECQAIVVEHVNSLNNLKALIAGAAETVEVLEEEAIEEYPEDTPEIENFPASETVIEPEPSREETSGKDSEIAPALAGEVEENEIREEAPPEELAEKLESFFGDEGDVPPPEPVTELDADTPEEQVIAPALTDEDELEEAPALTGEESEEDLDIAPALAGDEAEGTEIQEEEPPEELAGNLDRFFGSDEKVPPPEPPPEPTTEAAVADEEEQEELEPFAEESLDEQLEITPALSGDESEGTEIQEEELEEELAGNLDLFFGSDEEVAPFEGAEPAPATEKITEEVAPEPAVEAPEDQEEIVPALAGSPEEGGFATEGELEQPPEGLAANLDGFFGEDKPTEAAEIDASAEQVEEAVPAAEDTEELIEALFEPDTEIAPALTAGEDQDDIDLITPALSADEEEGTEILEEKPPEELAEKLEAFFGPEETVDEKTEVTEEEEMLLTPALAEEEDVAIPGSARPMNSPEEYQAAVAQIRSHFQEQEDTLRQEITSLKEEINNLRAQLESK